MDALADGFCSCHFSCGDWLADSLYKIVWPKAMLSSQRRSRNFPRIIWLCPKSERSFPVGSGTHNVGYVKPQSCSTKFLSVGDKFLAGSISFGSCRKGHRNLISALGYALDTLFWIIDQIGPKCKYMVSLEPVLRLKVELIQIAIGRRLAGAIQHPT